MTTTETIPYNAIVIGSGQSGGPLSTALAKAGRKTAIIERVHVGGTCINEGCTPTKTMVASARVAYLARRGADYGVHTGPITVDMTRVRKRKRDIVESFRSGSERRIKETQGVDLLMGEARFIEPHTLEVRMNGGGVRHLTAPTIFINVGCRPSEPKELEHISTLDSTSIMELGSVPEHLLVFGGGYIGLEFGQMFRRFGSDVTIIQRGAQLLSREDDDVAEEVAKILREDGVEVLLKTTLLHAEQQEDGRVQMTVRTPEGERVLTGSHVLSAA
ncbi:MAG TPA: FAD-dependent oxidoreductase, partial [Ktedonobacteraceae bacterium]|nr:FAD-dependent oxidoreductase [Ktedonobacteraceae bacterium]